MQILQMFRCNMHSLVDVYKRQAMGAAAAAAGAAAIKLGKEVVEQFGELEQNLGGSEAVFGEYAARIQKTGEEAYKNLGLSQSEYLATANKMGALFQGAGVDQQKSLELTEKAMQRAADMASVMGIDMQTAMESIAGAAKGNFTMMDNLCLLYTSTRKSRMDIMPKTPCRLPPNRLSSCCRPTFMKAGTAAQAAFLPTTCRPGSRYGIQLTFCCGLTGIGRCKYELWENENLCGCLLYTSRCV